MSKTIGVILSLQDKCSPQLQKVADKMGITLQEAKKLDNQTRKLAKAFGEDLKRAGQAFAVGVGAIASASAVMIKNSVEAGDKIDKMSQKMQMSRKTFQEMEYVFSQNGADISIMQTGMSKLSKTMDGVRTGNKASIQTFRALGIRLKDTSGHFKSTEKVMFEALSRLQKMPEGSKKSALALQLFGKSATELMPLLNGNAKGVEELRKKFNDLGMGMSDEQIDASVKFKDTMDTITRSIQGLGNQIGADMLPVLQQVADKIVENMPKIKETIVPVLNGILNASMFLINNFEILAYTTIGLTTAFGSFKVISGVVTLMNALKVSLTGATLAQQMLNFAMRANPIGIIVTVLSGAIGVIVALEMKFHFLEKAIKSVGETFQKVWSKIKRDSSETISVKADINESGKTNKPKNNEKPNKYASGSSISSGGLALVGEQGPELINLPSGSKVSTVNETKNQLNNSITINLNIAGNVIGNQEFINQISNTLGRQLKTALSC